MIYRLYSRRSWGARCLFVSYQFTTEYRETVVQRLRDVDTTCTVSKIASQSASGDSILQKEFTIKVREVYKRLIARTRVMGG